MSKKYILINSLTFLFLVIFIPSISFAAEGDLMWTQVSNPTNGPDHSWVIDSDSDGIYIGGTDRVPGNSQWRFEKRSLDSGSLIWSQVNNYSGNSDFVNDIFVSESHIYAIGYSFTGASYQTIIEKRNTSNGALIWSKIVNPNGPGQARLAVDSTGIYFIDGIVIPNGIIEKRSLSDGSLIWSKSVVLNGAFSDIALYNADIYIVGYNNVPGNYQWKIEKRISSDGSLVWSQVSNPSGGQDFANGIVVDNSGVYIVGGDSALGNYQWRIEKRSLSDGSLVWSRVNNPSGGSDYANRVVVNSSGIYIAGEDYSPGNVQWRIEKRDLNNGSLIWSQVTNPRNVAGFDLEEASSISINGSGVYVVGLDISPGNVQWRIEKRGIISLTNPCNDLAWAGSIAHGSSVPAYSANSVSCGSSCTVQTRTCDNGILSGSYTNQNCSVSACADCNQAPWGTIAHGSSVNAYRIASVPCGSSCEDEKELRVCWDGILGGTYMNQGCSEQACSSGSGNWIETNP